MTRRTTRFASCTGALLCARALSSPRRRMDQGVVAIRRKTFLLTSAITGSPSKHRNTDTPVLQSHPCTLNAVRLQSFRRGVARAALALAPPPSCVWRSLPRLASPLIRRRATALPVPAPALSEARLLDSSPHTSPYLPMSPHTSPHLPLCPPHCVTLRGASCLFQHAPPLAGRNSPPARRWAAAATGRRRWSCRLATCCCSRRLSFTTCLTSRPPSWADNTQMKRGEGGGRPLQTGDRPLAHLEPSESLPGAFQEPSRNLLGTGDRPLAHLALVQRLGARRGGARRGDGLIKRNTAAHPRLVLCSGDTPCAAPRRPRRQRARLATPHTRISYS